MLHEDTRLAQNSWHEASVTRPPASPPLAGRVTADVAVVGGGYAGLSAALELAMRGHKVALLEARALCWGASGRNGGQAIVGYGLAGEETIEAQLPAEDARRAWDITVEALDLLQERIARHAIACDYQPGHLTLAVNARKARRLEERVRQVERLYDYPQQWIAPGAMRDWVASERFHAGVFDARSGHLHPLKYGLGLAAAARDAGVQIFEDSPVMAIERGERPLLRTAMGEVDCRFVLLAGNVYLDAFGGRLAPKLVRRILPVGSYMIATEPMGPERADALIRQRAAVIDNNHMLDYFRLTPDHRLLFGGGESYSTASLARLSARMRRRMLGVFPQLTDLSAEHVWGGFVDVTMNQAPDFGRMGSNIYYLQGFSGHGLAMAGMAGKLAAEAIAGQSERFDVMARLRHVPFPGGKALRTPALLLGMLYYRLLDLF